MKKKFVYLVQGSGDLIKNYFHLADRKNADAIFLTYDRQVEGAIFFPDSTWAEGRNKLLTLLDGRRYAYYIFCDDDVSFIQGSWDSFESCLIRLNPLIGVPIVPKTTCITLRFIDYQLFRINDEQLMAFRHDIVEDGIVLPYINSFDSVHWWATCEIQEYLIQNFYSNGAIQFNTIEVSNDIRKRYETVKNKTTYRKSVKKWLSRQFRDRYKKIYLPSRKMHKNVTFFCTTLLCTLIFFIRHRIINKPIKSLVSEEKCRNILVEESDLLAQYLKNRS